MTVFRGFVMVFLGGAGLALMVSALPRFRRAVLARRLTPYLVALAPRPSALLGPGLVIGTFGAVFDPIVERIGRRLHRVLDDGQELPARLQAAGSRLDSSGFRAAQVSWGLAGLGAGLALAFVLASAGRSVSPILAVGMAGAFGAAGIAARDRALTKAIARRREAARVALPTVTDLVCLAVTAGESLRGALGMVAESGGGPLTEEIRRALRAARAGTPLAEALEARAAVLRLPAFDRFVASVLAAQERGIPLADALRSLAFDLREHDKRELIEIAGKKQISMLVPVVAMILPVAICFAFYPGVVAIRTLAR